MISHLYIRFVTVLVFFFSTHGQEELIDCPLCDNPTHVPQDPLARFVSGPNTFTCQSAYELGNVSLSLDNCTFWQSRGEVICQCAETAPEENECTLCQETSLPEPLREAIPGQTCAQVQVDAKRDKPEACGVYQQTIGVYCGCENERAEEVCRLCGTELSLPLTLVEEAELSCVELEFAANLEGSECEVFQSMYREICCQEEAEHPVTEDSAILFQVTWLLLVLFFLGGHMVL